MFCESFPPHRAKSDRQRKQGWLTLLSIGLLLAGCGLLVAWLVYFLQDIMRVQQGAAEYNDAIAAYNTAPIAQWLPGFIGEASAVLKRVPILILGETYSVNSATSTVLSTTLSAATSDVFRNSIMNALSSPSLLGGTRQRVNVMSEHNIISTSENTINSNENIGNVGGGAGDTITSAPVAKSVAGGIINSNGQQLIADDAPPLINTASSVGDEEEDDPTTPTLGPTTTTTEPPTPYTEQVYFSFVRVNLFERSPMYVKTITTPASCPRSDRKCSNETMEVFCRSNYGPLAVYVGRGCPPYDMVRNGGSANDSNSSSDSKTAIGNGTSAVATNANLLNDSPCGSCQYNLTLRTYCVVVNKIPNTTTTDNYGEDATMQSCYYPFADGNRDQDFFLNLTATTHAEQMPQTVEFVVRKYDDPFLVAQQLTQGTMVLQYDHLKIYLHLIMPTATFLVMGVIVFFIGVHVGRKKKVPPGTPRGIGFSDSDDDADAEGHTSRNSGRFGQVKTQSGRFQFTVVVDSQSGESIPLLIDTKTYTESQRRLLAGAAGSINVTGGATTGVGVGGSNNNNTAGGNNSGNNNIIPNNSNSNFSNGRRSHSTTHSNSPQQQQLAYTSRSGSSLQRFRAANGGSGGNGTPPLAPRTSGSSGGSGGNGVVGYGDPSDGVVPIFTANGEDGTVTAGGGLLVDYYGQTTEPVGYGDDPIVVTVISASAATAATMVGGSPKNGSLVGGNEIVVGGGVGGGSFVAGENSGASFVGVGGGGGGGGSGSHNNYISSSSRRGSASSGAHHHSHYFTSTSANNGGGGSSGNVRRTSSRRSNGSSRSSPGRHSSSSSRQQNAMPRPPSGPVGYGELDEPVGYGELS